MWQDERREREREISLYNATRLKEWNRGWMNVMAERGIRLSGQRSGRKVPYKSKSGRAGVRASRSWVPSGSGTIDERKRAFVLRRREEENDVVVDDEGPLPSRLSTTSSFLFLLFPSFDFPPHYVFLPPHREDRKRMENTCRCPGFFLPSNEQTRPSPCISSFPLPFVPRPPRIHALLYSWRISLKGQAPSK